MGGGASELLGPDFSEGVPAADLVDGKTLLGHAGGEAVLLARSGGNVYAVGATCTHYSGPLAEGLLVGDTVRCPWHHACFSLRTGEAVRAPALNPIPCFNVESRGDKLFVLGKKPDSQKTTMANAPESVVIVGGGAAGHAAAEMLRREGYRWPITILSADAAPPVDRPNLSKDYLAGTAPEEWIPLRPAEFFQEHDIELVQNARVGSIDTTKKTVSVEGGKSYTYGALLLATGAEPVKLSIPGADLPHVHTLRTLADSRAIIAQLGSAKRAVVVGASFIGLEVAAALRARNLEVHVVAPDALPLAKVLGPELGAFIKKLHEEHGVVFHLGTKPKSIDAASVTLEDGSKLAADLVVTGVGVRPNVALAEAAGLSTDRGVSVDAYLATSAENVYAAGDIARWPDPHTGESIRVEHWVVAQRQGQIAARNMLGKREKCELAPFFWSQHYDVGVLYVGHAEKWDSLVVEGNLADKDAKVSFKRGDKTLAVATVGRDLDNLKAELELERS
jgi:apoptosis-inducing factor 3